MRQLIQIHSAQTTGRVIIGASGRSQGHCKVYTRRGAKASG